MKQFALTQTHRPFLPPLVTLTHEHGPTVTLSTAYDDGLSNDAAVERLYVRAASPAPLLEMNDGGGTISAYELDKPRRVLLRDLGFSSGWGEPYLDLDQDDPPIEELRAALRAGFALDGPLLAILSADRVLRERSRAWDENAIVFGGNWDWRTLDEDSSWRLVEELREAVKAADDRAVHLTPMLDGTLRRRVDPWDLDVPTWEGQYDGAAMIVIKRHQSDRYERRLNALVATDHWLAQRLQILLMKAWAIEAFGQNPRWEWAAAEQD